MENMTEVMTNGVMEVSNDIAETKSGISVGAIIGGVVVAAFTAATIWFVKKRKTKKGEEEVIDVTECNDVVDCDEDNE